MENENLDEKKENKKKQVKKKIVNSSKEILNNEANIKKEGC